MLQNRYQLGGFIRGNSMQGYNIFFGNKNKLIEFTELSCDHGSAIARNYN